MDNMDDMDAMDGPSQELASRWARLGGAVIDVIIGMAAITPIMILTGAFDQMQNQQPLTFGQQAIYFVLGLGLFLLLHGYLLARQGQTIGKALVGTRIVSYETGEILPLGHVFGLRYVPVSLLSQIPVVGGLFGLVNVLFIFGQEKRCIHDLIAKTQVVRA